MTDDRGAAALVERLMAAEAELDWRYDDWSGRDITNAAMRRWCRAILGERGVFLPDGRHVRLAFSFWLRYRCGFVDCETVEPHEHGGGPPMREMTAEERVALSPEPKP